MKVKWLLSLLIATLCALAAYPEAVALTATGTVSNLKYSILAPEWIWQTADINVLLVLENTGESQIEAELSLIFPEGREDHFVYSGARRRVVRIGPGQTLRFGFKEIQAKAGYPLQTYVFRILIEAEGEGEAIGYSVRTIRGPIVSPGLWAIYLPVIMASFFCIFFLAILPRYSSPGAWRKPSQPYAVTAGGEEWFKEVEGKGGRR